MSPTPRSNPSTEPIRVRSVPPYGLPTAEEYADRFNNYAGGVNPLGYMGHEFAADGSYGYRPRNYPKRPLVSSRKPPLPPQPRPTTFDFGQDDEDALSMPVPESRRKAVALAPCEHHHNDDSTPFCTSWLSPPSSLSSPCVTIARSSVLNKYVFFVWRIVMFSYSLASLIVASMYGFSYRSIFVFATFLAAVAKELVLITAVLVLSCQKQPEWREPTIVSYLGIVLSQAAAQMVFFAPAVLGINYYTSTGPLRKEMGTYITSTPFMYLVIALCLLYLLDYCFTCLPPSRRGFILGAGLTSVIGLFGSPPLDYGPWKGLLVVFLLMAGPVFMGFVVTLFANFSAGSFHEPRLARMMAASMSANVLSDGNNI